MVNHLELRRLLGERIADLRVRRHPRLTQEQLAARIQISPSYLAKLEKGQRDIPISIGIRIAQALDVPFASMVHVPGAQTLEEWHRLSQRLCSSLQRSGLPPDQAGRLLEPILKAILTALASPRAKGRD